MKRFLLALVLLTMVAAMAGCSQQQSKQEESKGINIEFPGGSVKLGEGGVDVKAPGVDVRVDQEQGVDVKASGVDVKVERRQ